jgi:hypothetical protein
MIVTPYGDLEFGDRNGMRQWMAAHATRHRTYAVALMRAGTTIQGFPLFDQLNAHWLSVHYQEHTALAKRLGFATATYGLSRDFMENETQFYNWHRTHNLEHQQLDQGLGVVGG